MSITCMQHFHSTIFSCFLASSICQGLFVQMDFLLFLSSFCNFDTRNKLFSIHGSCVVHIFTWNHINHFSICFHPHLLNIKLHHYTIPYFIWTKFVPENRQAHVRILLQTLEIRCYCLYITWKSIHGCIQYPNLSCDIRLPAITSFPAHISTGNFQIFCNNFSTWHAVYISSVFFVSSLSAWRLSLVSFSPFKKRWKIIIYFSYLFKCRPYLYTKRTICQHKIFGVNALIFYFFLLQHCKCPLYC